MRILIAEDDPVTRRLLEASLQHQEFEIVIATDGEKAWRALTGPEAPSLALLDWMMPGLDGLEICRRVRASERLQGMYVILITARGTRDDIVAGLRAGADDYVRKPFDRDELRARLQVGLRVLALQSRLAEKVTELQDALSRVRQLSGLLPICSYCKKVRADENYWQQVESYVTEHSEATFSHGICPDCFAAVTSPGGEWDTE